MQIQAILTVSLILFSVIDIVGSLPVIINLKRQGMMIHSGLATLVAGSLMVLFLFAGVSFLGLLGLSVNAFALAGSLVIFLIGLEMLLGIRVFKEDPDGGNSGTIVPIAFPIVAGAGTLTTILSLKAQYDTWTILLGIAFNLFLVYSFLRASGWLARKLSPAVLLSLRKIFGMVLIAIAIQMFQANI